MPAVRDALYPARGTVIGLDEVELRASRSSGPGGQHANVTASRIEASFDVAASTSLSAEQKARIIGRCGPVIRAVAQDARSQARNRELALQRLAQRLRDALHVPRPRTKTKPTAGSKRRRLDDKKRRGQTKEGRRRVDGE
jgi:ribosome-associated protein